MEIGPVQEFVFGLAPVLEAILSKRQPISKLLVASGATPSRLTELRAAALGARIPVELCDRRKLDALTQRANHQGIVALLTVTGHSRYREIEEILDHLSDTPLVVLLDNIEDPHNLGAILRTCEAAGVDGVFVPDRRSAPLNETVAKTSAGAVEYVRVAKVTNLAPLIDDLKQRGFWVVGLEGDADTNYCDFDFDTALALVLGSEGRGIRRLILEKCDARLSIPMLGKINSLNVSVAAGVVLFEVVRQRRKQGT